MADTGSGAAQVAGYTQWQARDYFQTYYSEVVLPDEQVVLRYQIEQLAAHGERFGRALEYGCGPTLHRAIAAAHYVFRLDMADWLPDNLSMVREWLQADATNSDWRRFTEYVLHCEQGAAPNSENCLQREAETRRVVRGLHASDARWRHPLGAAREGYYDSIISGFCLDAVSNSKRVWRECMRNVMSMLAPGGLLIIHALHGCKAYKVGERMFPGADLSLDDMVESLSENGCARADCDVQLVHCPDNAVYGYSGILMAAARKR
ncbi:MAG: guanitoxin biosynthesis pre-guanitoxin forming N-methyltransferase GntF [Steroidobacteraceae bacterium]